MKNKIMKKTISILMLALFAQVGISAQNSESFNGIAYYKSSSNMNFSMDDKEISPAEMAKIQAHLKKSLEKEYELKFNAYESLYSEMEKLDGGATFQSGGNMIKVSSGEGDLYKNTKTMRLVEENEVMGKAFLVDDKLESTEWQIRDDKKFIGNYECQKAVFIQTFKTMELSDDNGESSVKESTDSAEVVAWFTSEIPINHGPQQLWGLPGLILELESQSSHIVCTKIVLNPDEAVKIEIPNNGKKVSTEELKMIRDKKMKEMQNKFHGDGAHKRTIIMSSGN
jgi:GLPGLI family protein